MLGINGIKSDGRCNTDRALAGLRQRGHEAVDTQYPMTRFIIQARSKQRQIEDAKTLMQYHHPGDAVVAHSRGCLVSLRMMQELGAEFSTVFWFRPAMDQDVVIPKSRCERLVVIHSPDDRAIALGAGLWYHDFGDAGRYGLYAGQHGPIRVSECPLWDECNEQTCSCCYEIENRWSDERVLNVQAPEYRRHEFWHHSDDFLPDNLPMWINYMDEVLRGSR